MTFEIIRKDVRPTPNDVDFSPVFDVINGQVPIGKVEELMVDAAAFGYKQGTDDEIVEWVWELVRAERLQEQFDAFLAAAPEPPMFNFCPYCGKKNAPELIHTCSPNLL